MIICEKLESKLQVIVMLLKGLTIYQDVVKEYKNKFAQVRSLKIIHSTLNVEGALVRPKGITVNAQWPKCIRKTVL